MTDTRPCSRCGRRLSKPDSVANGIGPSCAEKARRELELEQRLAAAQAVAAETGISVADAFRSVTHVVDA